MFRLPNSPYCQDVDGELKFSLEAIVAVKQQQPQSDPEPIGAQYGGKWIAWDDDAVRIVASGESLEEVRQQAHNAGVKLPGLEFVPPSDRAFVGGV